VVLELIQSVNPVVPNNGSNAGKQMFVINGKHWSKNEPAKDDTHVCLEEVQVEVSAAVAATDTTPAVAAVTKPYINVLGFSKDIRMSISDKIKTVVGHPEGYSQAIAFLLK
jgi:hypothetical protein